MPNANKRNLMAKGRYANLGRSRFFGDKDKLINGIRANKDGEPISSFVLDFNGQELTKILIMIV